MYINQLAQSGHTESTQKLFVVIVVLKYKMLSPECSRYSLTISFLLLSYATYTFPWGVWVVWCRVIVSHAKQTYISVASFLLPFYETCTIIIMNTRTKHCERLWNGPSWVPSKENWVFSRHVLLDCLILVGLCTSHYLGAILQFCTW